ncbi:S8 family serine peptidase [Saccharothrix longispora]|uniref:Subtilisin family serine protease n=1 Tax=Saccharothrix longispora TaxID=33920 RepID=A0ABU1PR45_9PSEU|nr:S8 family serine peptidase [Saccharothrix longispora]MDR6593115.1 subtilisin family serine protease [Saccharothrix longispora]
MSRRTRAPLALGLVAAVAMTATTGLSASAEPPGSRHAAAPSPATPSPGAREPGGTVTLLTGDVVTLRAGRAEVRPGPGRADTTFVQRRDERGDLHVLPDDVLDDLRSGRLDDRLFDVTALIRAGYDDRSTGTTPLIVTSDGPAVAGRPLPSIGGYAVRAPKDTAFWAGAQAAGVAKVWLDGPVRATLDRSVPQVGAPSAWAAGHTGLGARVAVLDTGVDAAHPDLAGAVVESRNFSDSPDTDDHVGHGTHVAATITGSGAHRGVAPDSVVLNGKVLGDHGGGYESDIIAGMEWAASAGADVVNMSLGSSMPTDGTDPMSQAVDRLTRTTGALFVVAAGNSGPSDETIGSPAAAEHALTVGAVDRADGLAGFSSRGPRRGDGAIKPDITAPGVDIVAAKAANGRIGTPVGDAHVALSGTSMAAPHVAGAAAILAARHPDWGPAELKSTLMANAEPNAGLTVHEQGAGRVDVAAAVEQTVASSPASLSLGTARWPHGDDAPIETRLVYHNPGTTPVTLEVTADLRDPNGAPAPAGMVELSPSTVTVPARGEVPVFLTVRTSVDGPDGLYGGVIVATGGATTLRTPIGVGKEVESYDVEVTFLGHDGEPTPEYSHRFVDLDHPKAHLGYDPSGTLVTRLPKGTFYLDATVLDPGTRRHTQFLEPAFTVSGPREVVFDARAGKPLGFRVEEPGAEVGHTEAFFALTTAWGSTGNGFIGFRPDAGLAFAPSTTSSPGAASFSAAARLARPDGDGTYAGSPYQYSVGWRHDGAVPESLDRAFPRRELVEVRSLSASAKPGTTGFRDQMAGGPLPLEITERYSPDFDWYGDFHQVSDPRAFPSDGYQSTARPRRFTAGRTVTEKWNTAVFGPAFPTGNRPDEWAGRVGDEVAVSVPLFTDQDPNHFGSSRVDSARTTLHRDGVLVGDVPSSGYFRGAVPAGPGTYVLRVEAGRSGVAELSTRVAADWTFASDTVAGKDPRPLPLLAVRFAPVLDRSNRAAAGRPFAFPVYVQRNGATGAAGVRTAVQVSYDDGATWKPVPLVRLGERWIAAVRHPAGADFVSLKAQARDAEGNSVDQTIIRAYGLR